uniref:Cupin type-1 domain-containing protein n=2 Tax=Quercus lobata TaxID=97700 RepID=A0A7N2MV03_QUELO
MKKLFTCLLTVALLALAFSLASAHDPSSAATPDPSPLQDFRVAVNNPNSAVDDFIFMGLDVPRNTHNQFGSNVTLVNVDMFPGLNTLGIALARVDYAPYGLNPPHIHPRATELLTVIEGTLLVGFVTSNPNNRRVFPMGLIHFQFNIGETNSVAFSSLDSQNPGLITIANATFGSNPPINPYVLAKAFQLDKSVMNYLQQKI